MEHLSSDHNDGPNQHENSHEQCDETAHPIVNMMESQWKLRQQHGQNSQWRESHYSINTGVRRKKEIQKSRTARITVWYSSMKINNLSKVI